MSAFVCVDFLYFFFFKQKTAYEMRISDWSSDVCSSDLLRRRMAEAVQAPGLRDYVRGAGGLDQRGAGRGRRTVMRRHHHVHARQPRRQLAFLDRKSVV